MNQRLVVSLVVVAVAALVIALFSVMSKDTDPAQDDFVSRGDAVGPGVELAPRDDRPLEAPPENNQPSERKVAEVDRSTFAPEESNPFLDPEAFTGALAGTVTGPAGQPVNGVQLELVERRYPSHLAVLALAVPGAQEQEKAVFTRSNAKGAFFFERLAPGSDYTLIAKHEEFARQEVPRVLVRPGPEVSVQDVQLSTGLVLSGYVRDSGGSPIEKARLELINQTEAHLPMDREPTDKLVAETDFQGYFKFPNVAVGTRSLTVKAKGYGSRTRNNLMFDTSKQSLEVDFELEPGLVIAGQIVGPDRRGVAGAAIEASSYQTAMSSRGRTKSQQDGQFLIEDLSAGTYILTVLREGYRDERLPRVEAGDVGLVIQLTEQGGIRGVVVDDRTGNPLTSFRVSVRQVNPNTTVFGRAFRSQKFEHPQGEFELRGLDQGTYVVQGSAPGYAPSFSDSFSIMQGMVTPDVVVRMTQGGTITGKVLDATTRDPVVGAVIGTFDNTYVENPFTELLGPVMPRMTADVKARTDEDGVFVLEGLNAEVYQLQITHSGYTRKTLVDKRVNDGGTVDLSEVLMKRGATLVGTVYDGAGQPLPGADVQMNATGAGGATGMLPGQMYKGRTNSDGRYELRNVAEGTYRITATRGGGGAGGGNPFEKILDMKNSETTVTVIDGQETVQDLYIGAN